MKGEYEMSQILLNLHGSGIILTAAIMLISGFLFTRLTKLAHLPNVTGYILSGVLIGPWCLHLVPQEYISQMDFITDVALAFIAFGVGKYFKLSALKKSGIKVVILTLFESLTAGVLITIVMLLLGLSLPFSLLLGAIGCATAPASTIMTIRQYKAKGHFIDTILQVVALDDAVALIAFSVCAAIVQATAGEGGLNMTQLLLPIFFNIVALLIGGGSGWLLSEAFCLYADRDRFKPYEKHHSTVREACETATELRVENLVLWHTEDTRLAERKTLYTAEGRQYFSGNLFVPDDLESIAL